MVLCDTGLRTTRFVRKALWPYLDKEDITEYINISTGTKGKLIASSIKREAMKIVHQRHVIAIPLSDAYRTYHFVCALENSDDVSQFYDNATTQLDQVTSF